MNDRTDLPPDVIRYVVRHGVNAMTFFRKTEISDRDLAALAAFLSRQSGGAAPPDAITTHP